jgi:hypothetical protein
MEYYPSFFPETALALLHALLYSMAYVLAGAALIGLSVYIALMCSEILFSTSRSKTQRAKVPQPARCAPVAEETLVLSSVEKPILAVPERLGQEAVRVSAPPQGAQIPMTVPANLESAPTWLCGFPNLPRPREEIL